MLLGKGTQTPPPSPDLFPAANNYVDLERAHWRRHLAGLQRSAVVLAPKCLTGSIRPWECYGAEISPLSDTCDKTKQHEGPRYVEPSQLPATTTRFGSISRPLALPNSPLSSDAQCLRHVSADWAVFLVSPVPVFRSRTRQSWTPQGVRRSGSHFRREQTRTRSSSSSAFGSWKFGCPKLRSYCESGRCRVRVSLSFARLGGGSLVGRKTYSVQKSAATRADDESLRPASLAKPDQFSSAVRTSASKSFGRRTPKRSASIRRSSRVM